jgi:hypothetical protein
MGEKKIHNKKFVNTDVCHILQQKLYKKSLIKNDPVPTGTVYGSVIGNIEKSKKYLTFQLRKVKKHCEPNITETDCCFHKYFKQLV